MVAYLTGAGLRESRYALGELDEACETLLARFQSDHSYAFQDAVTPLGRKFCTFVESA